MRQSHAQNTNSVVKKVQDTLFVFSDAIGGLFGRRDPVERIGRVFDAELSEAAGKVKQAGGLPKVTVEPPHTIQRAPASVKDAQQHQREPSSEVGFDTLQVEGLRKAYRGRAVVSGASLQLRRGEAVGLLGPNGAGKTTIFYMITGLVTPDAGSIHLDGRDVTELPMYQRARLGIGYLPQEASIFRGLSVAENIGAVLELSEANKTARADELEALMKEFHIEHLRDTPAIALSGGERRRCEIARALASRPAFILLDEPFAGVDPIAVGDIRELVRHLTNRDIGVLITDHNVRETLNMIDRATIIHSGRVLTEGTPVEIVSSDDARRLYLGEDFSL